MADAIDSPTPRDALVVGEDGRLTVETFDANGQVIGSPLEVSALDALVYIQNLIAQSAAEIPEVPATRVDGSYDPNTVATMPREELVALVRSLLDRVADEGRRDNPGVDPQALRQIIIDQINAAVVDPRAIRVVADAIIMIDPALVARVWPNLGEVLARPPGDPDSEWAPPEFGAPSRAIEGTTTGPGGSPPPARIFSVPSAGAATSAAAAADPVLPFTGQFQLAATDLSLQGIGLDFELRRAYLHGARYFGPLGPRWDHSFNLWLRETLERLPTGGFEHVVYRSTGNLRVERFRADVTPVAVDVDDLADAVFAPPDGTFDRLEKRAGRFVIITTDRREIRYDDQLRAESITDDNGNAMRLTYDSGSGLLVGVIDTCEREIRFEYDDRGHLFHVIDLSLDRHVWYGYDSNGMLDRVWKSVTAADDPLLVAGYRYWGDGAPGEMSGNMLALIDGRGREVLQLRYGDEPGLISYDRVVEQRDGGITYFDYEFVTDDDEDDRSNVAVVRCLLTLPSGDAQVLDYNRMGRLVRLVVDEADPLNPPRLVTSFRYNADGNVVREERADGSSVEYVYERELFERAQDVSAATAADRAIFGRLRRIIEHARPGASGPPTRVTEFVYDAAFGLMVEKRGPYYGDALGARIDPGPAWSQRISLDPRGNVVAIRGPGCTLPDGTPQAGGELTFVYDARGRLTRRALVAAPGETLATEFRYPPDPRLAPVPDVEVADADGLALERRYDQDAGGRLVEARTPSGMRHVQVLDHLGRVRREETWYPGAAQPAVQSHEYGPLPQPTRTIRNRLDASFAEEVGATLTEEFVFDLDGDVESARLRSADGAIDRNIRYTRDPRRRLSAYELGGVRFEIVRDARGLPIETRQRAGAETTKRLRSRYDAAGRLAISIDETGAETQLFYDGFGRIERVHHASGTEELFEWNAGDSLTRHRVMGQHPDRTGAVLLSERRQDHDESGRVIRETVSVFDPALTTAPVAAITSFDFDRADRIVAVSGPDGVRRTLRYDGLSRVVRLDDGAGTVTVTSYDDAARTVDQEITLSGVDVDGTAITRTRRWRTQRDAMDRAVATADALGNIWRWGYDSDGSTRFAIDPAGSRTDYRVGPDGMLDAIVEAVGRPEELTRLYRRDALRRLIGIDGPRGPVLAITRDVFGRALTGVSGPESVTVSYDAGGRLETLQDGTGSITTLGYGVGGRVASISVTAPTPGVSSARAGATAQLSFAYDGAGRLVRADDGARPVEVRYDSRGLVLSEAAAGTTSRWWYDLAGRVAAFQFPDGRRLDFARSADGRLTSVNDLPAGATLSTRLLQVWALGQSEIAGEEWRGVTRRRDRFDRAGRMVAIDETTLASGAAVFALREIADSRGYPRARRLAVGGVTETTVADSDGHGRIVGVRFDAAAAIDLATVVTPTATQATLDAAVAAASAAMPAHAEVITIALDPDGARRELRREAGGAAIEQRDYTIDVLGRATEIGSGRTEDAEGLPLTDRGSVCRYDAFRRLSRVERNGTLVAAVDYDALGRIAQITTPLGTTGLLHAGGAIVEARRLRRVLAQYVRLPEGSLIETGTPGTPRRMLLDAQATPVGLVASDGTIDAQARCDPFGEDRGVQGAWPEVGPRFQSLLGVDGLDVLLTSARTYDPRGGAFREIDPAGFPDGLNRGLFACGNPMAFADPTGLMAQPAEQTGRPVLKPYVADMHADSQTPYVFTTPDRYRDASNGLPRDAQEAAAEFANARTVPEKMRALVKGLGLYFGEDTTPPEDRTRKIVRNLSLTGGYAFGLGQNTTKLLSGDEVPIGKVWDEKLTNGLALLKVAGLGIRAGTIFGEISNDTARITSGFADRSKILWGTWNDYEKVIVNGEEVAVVGNRFYTRHAVDRMQPSGMRYGNRFSGADSTGGYPQIQQAGSGGPNNLDFGRAVPPTFVEQVINNSRGVVQANGNISHQLGSVQVILAPGGRVVTIITH